VVLLKKSLTQRVLLNGGDVVKIVLALAHQKQKRSINLERNIKVDKNKKRIKHPKVMHIRKTKDDRWFAFYHDRFGARAMFPHIKGEYIP
jgi:hypothetical protein